MDGLIALSCDIYWELDTACRMRLLQRSPHASARLIEPTFTLGLAPWECDKLIPEEKDREALRARLAARKPFHDHVWSWHAPDGGLVHMSVTGEPMLDVHGQFAGYRGIMRDITRQRAKEEEASRFRAAIDLSRDSVYLVDRETMRLIDVNASACNSSGYTRDEMLNMGPQDLLVTDRVSLEKEYDEVIASGSQGIRTEGIARTRDGVEFVFELQRCAIHTGGRWVIVSIAREITARKRAAEATQRLSRMYAAISAANEAILNAKSLDELYLRVCQAAIDAGQFVSASIMVPKPGTSWFIPAAVAGEGEEMLRESRISSDENIPEGRGLVGTAFRTLASCVSNDFSQNGNMRTWSANQNAMGVVAGAALPLVRNGTAEGVLLLYSRESGAFDPDIVRLLERMAENIVFALENFDRNAERQRIIEELRKSEERYRSIVENMSDGYFEVDLHGSYTYVNAALCRIHGCGREEAIGLNYRDFTDADTAQYLFKIYSEAFRNGQHTDLTEHHIIRKDGSMAVVETSMHVNLDASGKRTGFRGVSREITARRRAEDAMRASEQKYRTILSTIEDAYYEVDLKGKFILFNASFCRMLGYTENELRGMSYRRFQTLEAAENVYTKFNEVYHTGVAKKHFDWEMIHKDGRKLLAEGSIHLIKDTSGKPIGFRGMLRDVTVRRAMEEALRESEERFRDLAELSSDWYWEQDEAHRFVQVSGDVEGKSGLAPEDFWGKTFWELPYEGMSEDDWAQHRETRKNLKPFYDLVLKRSERKGRVRYISISGLPVFDRFGLFKGYRGTGKDITERTVAEERIRYLASHDPLTSLPNRMSFSQTLSAAVRHARRYDRRFAVMFIDLDHFKDINDTLGHSAGDLLLKEVADRLQRSVRASDVVARLAGDEFVVLLQELGEIEQARKVAEKIIASTSYPIVLGGHECRVTASIGICIFPDSAQDEQQLMKRADIAMYEAKHSGRSQYRLCDEVDMA